jgi:hypothetical protein
MATTRQSKTSAGTPTAASDLPSVEEATQRIRDLNERLIESSKSAGLVALDAYEKALQSLVDFEQKVASASQLDWVSALATTHAKFIADVTTSYTEAARDLLK